MKRLLILLILLIPSLVSAQTIPAWVVCDPYPTTVLQPTHFELTLDGGAPFNSPAFVKADSSVILHYDVSGVSVGTHRLTIKACITPSGNQVGGCSSTVPFDFARGGPNPVTGIRLSNQ